MSFSFKLLGGITLEGESGPLTGPAVQRYRLAFLAVLATSRRGVSRDKLLALLWRGRDAEPARQLLNQSVHALRRALGADSIVSVGEELQFNPALVYCDVLEFEAALAKQDRMRAVGLYRGPFLDGFFLSESPEFERWMEGERDRLAASFRKALESLADREEQAGDPAAAAEWWKQLATHDRYDSRVALRLMRALAQVGNRAGALQHGLAHQQLLRQELEIEPAAEVLALMERLRREPSTASSSRQSETGLAPAPALPAEALPAAPVSSPSVSTGRSRFLIAAALVVAAGALWGVTRLGPGRERPSAVTNPVVDEIAQAVARELNRRQAGDTGRTPAALRTRSIAAYEAYLRGNDPAAIRSDSAARKALEHFQRAVALDSTYAAAWAGLARLTVRVLGRSPEHREQALAAARRALALDDSLADAHAVLARHLDMAGDARGAEQHFARAIALEPGKARHREWFAAHLLRNGRPAEALTEAERALAVEPLSPTAAAELARALIANHRCEEALAKLEPLQALDPPPLRVAGLMADAKLCLAKEPGPRASAPGQNR